MGSSPLFTVGSGYPFQFPRCLLLRKQAGKELHKVAFTSRYSGRIQRAHFLYYPLCEQR